MDSKSALLPSAPSTAVSRPWESVAALQDRRACAVAEQHAGVAVRPVHDGGQFFRADHQDGVIGARHDELLADLQPVDEAGTRGLHIKGGRPAGADFLLHQAGGVGKGHVRGDGGDDDELDLVGGDAGHFHGALGGVGGEVGGEFVFGRETPFLDAGARDDPFIGGVHHFFQVGVGQHPCRARRSRRR